MTAAQQAGKAPMCKGSTTCCATTSALVSRMAQEASWDSRTMVEKPVRKSEFCISCTMPERLALMISRSTAPSGASAFISCAPDQDVPKFIDARNAAGRNKGGGVELIDDGGT